MMEMDYDKMVHGLVKVFTMEEINHARKNGKLLNLDIEFTKDCNLRCIYCYANGGEKQEHELEKEKILDIIDQAKNLGLKQIIFTGGEPLIRKDFFEVAEYARSLDVYVSVYTNGTLIDEEVAKKMFDLKIFPCVKLDSLVPEIQDELSERKGTFEMIMKGIKNLKKVGYESFNINTVICNKNLDNLPGLWIWARKNSLKPNFLRLGPKGRARDYKLAVGTLELKKLFEKLSEIDKTMFNLSWDPTTPFCGMGCNKLYVSCYLGSDGTIQPCTGVDVVAGNIKEERLETLLNSEVFSVARNIDKHIKGACKECENLDKCYGCRGLAFYINGDFTFEDPLCWNNPRAL